MKGSAVRAFVLAGGHAKRMGFDKARAPFFTSSGEVVSLAVATALPLLSLGLEVTVVRRSGCSDGPWTLTDGRTLTESIEPDGPTRHPLWGVEFALGQVCRDALIVPCDMPWISVESWQRVLCREAPVVAVGDDGVHPLLGRFSVTWRDRATALARSGGRVSAFAEKAGHIFLPADELRNVNTPASLAQNWEGRLDALSADERIGYEQRGVVFPL